jgi:hypothetical protein
MTKTMTRIGLGLAVAIVATVGIAQVRQDRSPGSPGDREGTAFRMPADTTRQVASPQPLRVDSFQVQRIAGRSDLGAEGDLLITFTGQGFQLTSTAPRVLIGAGVTLESTEVNRNGTELYVLVPRNMVTRIQAVRFDSVVVANPGGREDTEFARASIRVTAARLLRPDPNAPAVRVVYRDGAFSREPAQL